MLRGMADDPAGIGARVRARREALRMRPADLARAAGVDQATISRLEGGSRRGKRRQPYVPGWEIMQKLATALSRPGEPVTVADIMGDVPHPPILAAEAMPAIGEAVQLLAVRFAALPPEGQARVLRVLRAILE